MSNQVYKSFYSKGRLTMPKEIRDLSNMKEGDVFIVRVDTNKIILKKARVIEEK